jgi:methionyl-tRNA formyltransferase
MKIIFFGSDNFALPSLRLLSEKREDIDILSVITKPDRRKGRGLKVVPLEIKVLALKLSLSVYQPEKIDNKVISYIKSLSPELIVVVAYGRILPKQILEIPPRRCVNLHSSLLPDLRGAGAIAYSIIRGYTHTGITTMYMSETMDAGDIILQKKVEIKLEDTTGTLSEKLAEEGAELLYCTLKNLKKGDVFSTPQDESRATYAPMLKKEDGLIDWNKNTEEIFNLIRGLNPWPSAYTYLRGKMLKIHTCQPQPKGDRLESVIDKTPSQKGKPGEIIEVAKNKLIAATGKGNLSILEVQLENRRKMTIEEFLQGHRLEKGETLHSSKTKE